MFKKKKTFTFDWPVKVEVPVAGKHEVQEFTGTFLVPDIIELQAAFRGRAPQDGDDAEVITAEERAKADEFLRKHFVGYDSRVGDEDGKPLPYTEENRDWLINHTLARPAIVKALFEGVAGRKAKNSKAPPAG